MEADVIEPLSSQAEPHSTVIFLRERSYQMIKNDLIEKNPLRVFGREGELLKEGEFGAVLARAGIGKTSLLVQIAMDSLLKSKNVLHISLDDPVTKVCMWYTEVFKHVAEQYNISMIDRMWDEILPHRFIMTFKVDDFTVPRLEERLLDITEQGIFMPQVILIDGFPFDSPVTETLRGIKNLASDYHVPVWFSVLTHRHEEPGPGGIPARIAESIDCFDTAIQLSPETEGIHIKAVKGTQEADLLLDPETMLIKGKQ